VVGQLQAVPIISNLPGNDQTSTFLNAPTGGSNGGADYDSKAAGFALPAGPDYLLDSVELRLEFFNLSSVPVIEIYDDNGGAPSAPLTTLANPSFSVGTATYAFTPSSPLTLTGGNTFWVVASNAATVANSYRWLASSPAITPTGIATSAGYLFDYGPPPPSSPSSFKNSYAVNATMIPEPSTLALSVVGVIVLRIRRRGA
jgi:hypothetical protein